MFDNHSASWAAAGACLGLEARRVCSEYREGDSFRQLRSRIGARARQPTLADWLVGAYDGAAVVITRYTTRGGNFGHGDRQGNVDWTSVLVELDPPLFMGARVAKQKLLSRLFGATDIQVGVADADAALHLQAMDSDKLRALLAPRDAADSAFLDTLVKLCDQRFFFTDSIAGFKLEDTITDPGVLGGCVQTLAHFRRQLLARAERVQLRPHEAALADEWARYAAHTRLEFDPARFAIQGVVDGVPIHIALGSTALATQTVVSIRWPHPIHLELRLSKFDPRDGDDHLTGGHRFIVQVFTDLMGQDIRVGDKPFDDAFQIQGYPEEHIRSVLSSPDFRANMLAISGVATEVDMTGEGLAWFLHGAPPNGQDLDGHVQMAVRVVKSLYPPLRALAPYRS